MPPPAPARLATSINEVPTTMTTTITPDTFVDNVARILRAAPSSTRCPVSAALPPLTVHLTVDARLTVGSDMPPALRHALRRHFTLPNPAYEEAEQHGRSTADLPPVLLYYDTRPDGALVVPRGATPLCMTTPIIARCVGVRGRSAPTCIDRKAGPSPHTDSGGPREPRPR